MLYESIKPLKVYNSQRLCYLPKGTKNGYGNVVFMLSNSQENTLNALTNGYINYRTSLYKFYYIDAIYKDKIGRKRFIFNNTQVVKKKFNDRKITPPLRFIPYASRKTAFKKNQNMFVDLGDWTGLFFKYRLMTSTEVICNSFISFLNKKVNDDFYKDYEKIIYMDIPNWFPNGKEIKLQRKELDNPISILLFSIYRFPEKIKELGDIIFLITDSKSNQIIKLPASELTKENFNRIKTRIKSLRGLKYVDEEEELEDEEESNITPVSDVNKSVSDNREKIINSLKKNLLGNVEDDIYDELVEEDDDIKEDTETVETEDDDLDAEIEAEANKFLDDNKDLLEKVDNEVVVKEVEEHIKKKLYIAKFKPERTQKEIKKVEELNKKQSAAVGTPSIEDIKSKTIEETNLSKYIKTTNPNIVKSSYRNFDKAYNEKKLNKDIDEAISKLSDGDIKVFITDKEEKDTSDQLNLKKTLTYHLEDEKGKKMTLKFDVPIIIDDKFIYLNGSKKIIQHQFVLKPIVKTDKDTVQIVSLYNKIFIRRKGEMDLSSSSLKKYILKNSENFRVKFGNSLIKNKEYETGLDFDIIAKNIHEFTIGSNRFITEIDALIAEYDRLGIKYSHIDLSKNIPIGYNKKSKEIIYIKNTDDYTEKIVSYLPNSDVDDLEKIKIGNRLMYAQCTVLSKDFPLIFFMLFCDGFKSTMEKCGIEYKFVSFDEAKSIDKFEYGTTALSDGVIIWKRYPLKNSLLMNGLQTIPMNLYSYEELESKDTYIFLLSQYFNWSTAAFNLDQYKNFMIDHITKEILIDFGYPTDLTELMAYAAELLTNNKYIPENDLRNMRIRSNEIIAFHTYNAVVNAYNKYRKTQHKRHPTPISVKRDAILVELKKSKLVEENSVLNPVLELEKNRSVTFKGERGINKDRAMSLSKRSYNESMLGVVGISTSPDANVGILRQLTLEPSITSTRGYIDVNGLKNVDKLSSANLLTPAELLTPLGVQHDDPTRTSMAYKQSKYMVLLEDSDPVLIGNKVESVIPYHLSDEFCVTAKMDGVINDIQEDFVIVKYSDGSYKSIDISPQVKKNASSGFYIESQLICNKKVGDKIKEGDVIAYNEKAFTPNDFDNGVSMNLGALTKIAIVPNWDIFEDSAPISAALSKRLSTVMITEKPLALNKEASVDFMVKVGDKIKTGDPLIRFDQSPDDPVVNKFLESIREELDEEILESTSTTLKSKYTGEIIDIKIFSTVELDDLSPSLKKIVSNYYSKLKKRNKVLDKYKNDGDYEYYKSGHLITEAPIRLEPDIQGKIRGVKVDDGVLIVFYIKYRDNMKKGDKMCSEFALKSICSHVIDEGYEPYSEYRPDEEISSLVAPLSISARKTPSIFLAMFGNKLLIELKRQLKDIYLKDE